MKFALAMLAAFALLLAGCASSPPASAGGEQSPQATQAPQASPGLPPVPRNNSSQVGAQVPPAPGNGQAPPSPPPTGGAQAPPSPPSAPSAITLAQLSAHNTVSDCWMAINGSVYDLSAFSNHPGGEAYVPYCGTDATQAYATKGGMGRPHSGNAVSMLPRYFIGAFAG